MEHNEEHNINYEYITRYLRRTLKPNEGLLAEMEEYAKANEVPIAQPETSRFIQVLLKSAQYKNVLEVGAAIGYSSIIMSQCGCNVTTIERDENMFEPFADFVHRAGAEDKITLIKGDASDVLKELDGEYDFIFIDAAKGQYMEFYREAMRMLKKGGLLFSDNVLYKGMVATDELFKRRKVTIIHRLRDYLTELCSNEELDTAIIPIGDGCAISFKK